jgi:anaerobic selenocysteine-containing dehydrogenase
LNSDNLTTCPLDCYDGCSIVYKNGKLRGDKSHPVTKGYLCSKMNKFLEYDRLESAYFEGEKISLDKALEILLEKLNEYKNGKNLFFQGSGNIGRLQGVTKEFFVKFGFFGTSGSLCDGAGDAGIKEGRGANLLLPPSEIDKSEVVVIWGRDPNISNTHILPYLKNKKLIVIDPYSIELSKKADIYLQVKPRGDFFLALMMARIVYMQQLENSGYIKEHTNGFDDFVELFESYHMKQLSLRSGIDIDKAWEAVDLIEGKKAVFLVGIGVQKYFTGHYVLRAIDSLAAMLGLFGREGSGVSFLSDSFYGFKSSLPGFLKKEAVASVDFSKFDMVFIQGANPAVSMPNSKRVKEGLKKAKFSVYFGLYENETSKLADLVLPAVDFLCKNDIRTTYGHEYIGLMPKLKEDKNGISEYDLTSLLMKKTYSEGLKDEKAYVDEILSSNTIKKDGLYISKTYEKTPYQDGFCTDDKKFNFLDEYEDDFEEDYEEDDERYYLVTKKYKNSLNSSFKHDNYLYIPPLLGFEDDEKVKLVSDYDSAEFFIKIDINLRNDTLMCYAGNRFYNYLTPSMTSLEGECAVYQELKVTMKKV